MSTDTAPTGTATADAATTIALVRHGQTDWNHNGQFQGSSNTELNDTGRDQARQAAAYLKKTMPGVTWDLVRHSPLNRAAETGRIIAAKLGVERLIAMPTLTERDWASAEGRTLEQMYATYPQLEGLDEFHARESFPGVEPLDLVTDRGVYAIDAITQQHPGQRVIVAAHGTLLRFTLSDVFDVDFPLYPNAGVVVVRSWRADGRLHVEELHRSFPDEEADADPTQPLWHRIHHR